MYVFTILFLICSFAEEIELPKNTMFSCGITHILTPGSFYIQRIGPEFGVCVCLFLATMFVVKVALIV